MRLRARMECWRAGEHDWVTLETRKVCCGKTADHGLIGPSDVCCGDLEVYAVQRCDHCGARRHRTLQGPGEDPRKESSPADMVIVSMAADRKTEKIHGVAGGIAYDLEYSLAGKVSDHEREVMFAIVRRTLPDYLESIRDGEITDLDIGLGEKADPGRLRPKLRAILRRS